MLVKTLLILLLLLILSLVESKNVILLIANGMGLSMLPIVKYHAIHFKNIEYLNIEKAINEGKITIAYTNSDSHLVPDSAASATAIACGILTENNKVGMDTKNNPQENLIDIALKLGKSVGIVTTASLTDATVAAFSSHVKNRNLKKEIAEQQMKKNINILLGGGKKYYDINKLRKSNYKVITTKKELEKINLKTFYLFGLFADEHLNYRKNRTPAEPSLPFMTKKAIELLSQDHDGFFLLVESARIDHAAHSNSIDLLLEEIYELDETIGTINSFLEKEKNTTFIITADHDTGIPFITPKISIQELVDESIYFQEIEFGTKEHSSIPVIVITLGKATLKKNLIQLTEIFHFIKSEF